MNLTTLPISRCPGQWKSTLLALLFYPLACYSQRVNLPRGKQFAIPDVLAIIEQQTHFTVLYSPATLRRMPPIDVNLPPNMKVGDALNALLAGLRLYWDMASQIGRAHV